MEVNIMSLKTRIKNLANEQGIGLTALEAKLGFGNGTITKWDKTTPNADKLNKVAQYFGVSMDYLLIRMVFLKRITVILQKI